MQRRPDKTLKSFCGTMLTVSILLNHHPTAYDQKFTHTLWGVPHPLDVRILIPMNVPSQALSCQNLCRGTRPALPASEDRDRSGF